jgi:hypothetical protein
MNILHKPEQAFVPANQPKTFPTFHLIPETGYVRRKRACNQPSHHQQRSPTYMQQLANKPRRILARQKLQFQQYCAATWSRLKAFGRELVRKLFWRVILPLSIACALWIPLANPADLPL